MDTHEHPPMAAPQMLAEPAEKSRWAVLRRIRRRLGVRGIVLAAVLAVALAAGGFIAVARATDSPAFCGSACHEMTPYHEAWSRGGHKNVACIECHVDSGSIARMEHKVVALQEVVDHIKGAPDFPLVRAPDVPDSRCLHCHEKVVTKVTGFSHADHAKRGACVRCHSDAGHKVTIVALKQAGIFNVDYRHSVEPTRSAVPGNGKANVVGHTSVGCSDCHDMATMKCAQCHTPSLKHAMRPKDCAICHAPGPRFVFTHPTRTDCATCHTPPATLKPAHVWKGACTTCHVSGAGVDWKFTHPQITACGDCHTPPSKHKWAEACTTCHRAGPGKSFAFTHPNRTDCETCHARPASHRSGDCTKCHHNRGVNWAFAHPGTGADCQSCHSRPSNHRSGTCATCHHKPGVSWAFSHPGSSATCTNCHTRPSKHRSGRCQTCHKRPGRSWAFTHPGAGASCANCHSRPSRHRSGACQNCHRKAGKSWAFTHPGAGTTCANCHTPPTSHFGTNCSACHTPGTAWANAHFAHPAIPGGAHTYKTWPCAKCHPSGPPAHYCTCHGSANGPKGD